MKTMMDWRVHNIRVKLKIHAKTGWKKKSFPLMMHITRIKMMLVRKTYKKWLVNIRIVNSGGHDKSDWEGEKKTKVVEEIAT